MSITCIQTFSSSSCKCYYYRLKTRFIDPSVLFLSITLKAPRKLSFLLWRQNVCVSICPWVLLLRTVCKSQPKFQIFLYRFPLLLLIEPFGKPVTQPLGGEDLIFQSPVSRSRLEISISKIQRRLLYALFRSVSILQEVWRIKKLLNSNRQDGYEQRSC